jgi:hypothetical protein
MTQEIDYKMLARELVNNRGDFAQAQAQLNKQINPYAQEFYGSNPELSQKSISTVTTTYGHGPGGLFSMPGLSRPVFSAMLLPNVGLQSRLVSRASMDTNPLYGIFTGVTATTGSEATDACADPPTAGLSKLCMHSFVFAKQARQTRAFDVDRAGLIVNRGEFLDLQLVNNPFGVSPENPSVPQFPGGVNPADVLKSEAAKAVFELGVAWSRDFAREVYTGNPTNNSGDRKYYYGLDILINTGYRDAESAQACPAADSIVRSFGNARVDLASNGAAIVTNITYMYRNLKYIAERTELAPVKWVLTMRFGAFYEITQVWPIAYYTTRNSVTDSGQFMMTDGKALIDLRDRMRNNLFLLIDGEEVEVVIDEAITETESPAGQFTSTIYFVPLTVMGGTLVTYFEYINYNGPFGAVDMANAFAPGSYQASDGGRFLWHRKPPSNFCVQMVAKTQPRLLLLTPFIAARLTNVRYAPYIHERGAFTDDGYFANGGRTDRLGFPPPSFYSPTA